jgi:hypothetical protein
MEVPTLQNRPDQQLDAVGVLLFQHFGALNRQRPSAFGKVPNSIPFTQIEAYHRIYCVGDYMSLAEFCDVILELDNLLIGHYTKLAERDAQ